LEIKQIFQICFDWNEKTGIESKARLITVRHVENAKIKAEPKGEVEVIKGSAGKQKIKFLLTAMKNPVYNLRLS